MEPAIGRQIYDNLRLVYRQCLEEGIPPSMQALVDQLDEETSRNNESAGAEVSPDGADRREISDRSSA